MGSFSIWHWLIVLAIVVLIFGTKKLRNMGSDVGGAIKNFKSAMKEGEESVDEKPMESLTRDDKKSSQTESSREKTEV